MCSYPVMSTGNPISMPWAKYGHLKHDGTLILVECRALWGEPERDICHQRKYTVLHTMSNAWISDLSYNTGTELTGWSRHAYHWWLTLHTDSAHRASVHMDSWKYSEMSLVAVTLHQFAAGLQCPPSGKASLRPFIICQVSVSEPDPSLLLVCWSWWRSVYVAR